jgi:CPA1 family monovalent cation:H+ antiporter
MAAEYKENLTDLGLGTLCIALTLGIISRSWLQKILPIPYSVVLLLFGLAIGTFLVTTYPNSHDIVSNSVHTWVDISPEAVIFCILPILIFEASFSANLFLFYKSLPAVFCMAIPLVVFSSVVIGLVGYFRFPYGWDFPTALLLGSILSPTVCME